MSDYAGSLGESHARLEIENMELRTKIAELEAAAHESRGSLLHGMLRDAFQVDKALEWLNSEVTARVIVEQANRIAELEAANKALRAFADDAITFEGYEHEEHVWECAEKHGLLRVVPYDPEEHGDGGFDFDMEPGDDWFERTELLGPQYAKREGGGDE